MQVFLSGPKPSENDHTCTENAYVSTYDVVVKKNFWSETPTTGTTANGRDAPVDAITDPLFGESILSDRIISRNF